jgi:hypothetical protein
MLRRPKVTCFNGDPDPVNNNMLAMMIFERCVRAYEKVHLPDVECPPGRGCRIFFPLIIPRKGRGP